MTDTPRRTRLSDLNAALFAQLDRLGAEDLDPDDIEREAKRATAIVSIADQVIATADLQLKAAKLYAEHGQGVLPMLPQIGKASE
ncbi:MAG: hypothetical protein ACLFRZ_12315 [Rhodosalinus sp.]